MPRICSACGRDIPGDHKVLGKRMVLFDRGSVPGHRTRIYQCNVVPITNDTAFEFIAGRGNTRRKRLGNWVPGQRRVPDTMQRTERNPARYIHRDSLKAQAREEKRATA
jgi:hypothetical protein